MPEKTPESRLQASTLARFIPLSELSQDHRQQLCHHVTVRRLEQGELLEGAPSLAAHLIYVLEGALRFSGGPYQQETVEAGTPVARFALSGMESTHRRAKALRPATVLVVERARVSDLMLQAQSAAGDGSTARAAREHADLAALLLDAPLLAPIPASHIDRLSQRLQRMEVDAGATVIRQGEPPEHYYLVEAGHCQVLRSAQDGAPPGPGRQLGAGDGFGEDALLTGTDHEVEVEMVSAGVLLRLGRSDFLELIAEPLLVPLAHERAEDLAAMGARWVDVRTAAQHQDDALDGAIHLPLDGLRERTGELPADGCFITYCDSGRRARAAAFLLAQRGIQACYLRDGIAARRPDPRLARPPTQGPSQLRAELARSEAALEHAIHDVASAQAQQAVHSQRVESGGQRERVDARLEAASENVKRAQAALEPIKTHKLALEQKLRDAEAAAASRRRHAEVQCERLRQETQALLEQEKQRLAEQYRDASARLQRIEETRAAAESQFEAQRRRLHGEFEAARVRFDQEAHRIRNLMETARREAESRAETLRSHHVAQVETLRRETEAALAEERQRLDDEVARSASAQDQASRLLASTEAERRAAQREATRVHEHMAAEDESRREQQRERDEQALRLQQAQQSSADRLMSARAALEEAEQRRLTLSEQIQNTAVGDDRYHRLMDDLKHFEARVQDADEKVSLAQEAHDQAKQQVDVAVEVAATTRQREEELRVKLYEEMEQFISEEERRSAAELEQAERYAHQLDRIQQEKEARKKEEEQATASMFDELKGMLEGAGGEDPFEVFNRQRFAAEEKARLVRDARLKAAERTRAARAALESSKKPGQE